MNCPQCKKDAISLEKMTVGVAGISMNVEVCGGCAKVFQMLGNTAYESPKTSKTAENSNPRLEEARLSEEEIAKTQALKPSRRFMGRARELDSVDGDVERVFVISDGSSRMNESRSDRVHRKFQRKFKGKPYEIVSDDPAGTGEVIARRVNA